MIKFILVFITVSICSYGCAVNKKETSTNCIINVQQSDTTRVKLEIAFCDYMLLWKLDKNGCKDYRGHFEESWKKFIINQPENKIVELFGLPDYKQMNTDGYTLVYFCGGYICKTEKDISKLSPKELYELSEFCFEINFLHGKVKSAYYSLS